MAIYVQVLCLPIAECTTCSFEHLVGNLRHGLRAHILQHVAKLALLTRNRHHIIICSLRSGKYQYRQARSENKLLMYSLQRLITQLSKRSATQQQKAQTLGEGHSLEEGLLANEENSPETPVEEVELDKITRSGN